MPAPPSRTSIEVSRHQINNLQPLFCRAGSVVNNSFATAPKRSWRAQRKTTAAKSSKLPTREYVEALSPRAKPRGTRQPASAARGTRRKRRQDRSENSDCRVRQAIKLSRRDRCGSIACSSVPRDRLRHCAMPPTRFSEIAFRDAHGDWPAAALSSEHSAKRRPKRRRRVMETSGFLSHREPEETPVFISHFIMAACDAETGTIRCA